MAGLSSRGLFLSYRREDAAPYARLLQFQFRERIPDARVSWIWTPLSLAWTSPR